MDLPGYDAWLERPYQERAAEAERLRCPECDGLEAGPDWDAIAEARAEARADDYDY